MLIHLVRKDFLIVKKYVLLMLAGCVIIPPFMMWRTDAAYVGAMSFVLSAIFSVFMLLQYVSSKENQYAKASTLLCATPYPRKLIVLSKYVFCLLIYGVCCLIFWTEALIFPVLGGFHIEIAASMFLVLALFLGIYLPVQYKLGYETTKFAFFIIIMASPFIVPQLLKMQGGANYHPLVALSPTSLSVGAILIGAIVLVVSAGISIRVYCKADLS